MLFCAFVQLVTTVTFFSVWDKSRVKWDNSQKPTQKMRTCLYFTGAFNFSKSQELIFTSIHFNYFWQTIVVDINFGNMNSSKLFWFMPFKLLLRVALSCTWIGLALPLFFFTITYAQSTWITKSFDFFVCTFLLFTIVREVFFNWIV